MAKIKYSLTLLDLLDTIYWEISFYGSPSQREETFGELRERMKDIDLKDTIPFDEIFKEETDEEE